MKKPALAIAAALLASTASAQPVELGGRSILDVARSLKPGEYVWAPQLAADGPALVVVNLATQRLVLFRNGVAVAASTISSGSPGHETPTGVFTILQKNKEHYSSTYNNAPMPNMQRLTWKGIALHAGKLPGYPASHGCVRLPHKFSGLLFGATNMGMTVVITSLGAVPATSAAPDITPRTAAASATFSAAPYEWHPERSTSGVTSVVISAADQYAIVMRGGVEIGRAPVRVAGDTQPTAYVLKSWDQSGMTWLKLQLSANNAGMTVGATEGQRFDTPVQFRRAVAEALRPGSLIIVTPESLTAGSPGRSQTVIQEEPAP